MPMDDVYDDDGDGGAVERCTQSDDFFKLLVCSSCLSHLVFRNEIEIERKTSKWTTKVASLFPFFLSFCLSISAFELQFQSIERCLFVIFGIICCLSWMAEVSSGEFYPPTESAHSHSTYTQRDRDVLCSLGHTLPDFLSRKCFYDHLARIHFQNRLWY